MQHLDPIIATPVSFTKADYDGWAGANNFPDGSAPFTVNTFIDDTEVQVVCCTNDNGDTTAEFVIDAREYLFIIDMPDCGSAMDAAFTLAAFLQVGFEDGAVRTDRLIAAELGNWS